jgi:hypothetical protein
VSGGFQILSCVSSVVISQVKIMSKLVLFFTQADTGAPGYLSQKGESDSQLFASSAFAFIHDSLGVNLVDQMDNRITMVSALARKPSNDLQQAIADSAAICPDVVLFCGANPASKLTASAVAAQFAIPAIQDMRVDAFDTKAHVSASPLQDFFDDIFLKKFISAKLILIGTSMDSLIHWMSAQEPGKAESLRQLMTECQGLPAVTCGYDQHWIFDF